MNAPGQVETMTLEEVGGHDRFRKVTKTVDWRAKGLKFVRTRWVSDPGFPFWDHSYSYGVVDGEDVRVTFHSVRYPSVASGHSCMQRLLGTGCF